MRLLDFFSSTKRPKDGVAVCSAGDVRAKLLGVNRPTAPFEVIDGSAEGVDLIAEWRIVDANWYQIFAKAGLSKVFKISMKLDEANHEVRAVDREYEVSWTAGVPTLSLSAEAFRGQKQSIEFGKAYAFTENLEYGQVYNYRFETKEIKQPLQDAVTTCGWTYKGVAFGKL
jgi:hypothetical protein